MSDALKIGILYSTTGPYGAMGVDARDGAMLAIEARIKNIAKRTGRTIEPLFYDPHASLGAYLAGARHLLREEPRTPRPDSPGVVHAEHSSTN